MRFTLLPTPRKGPAPHEDPGDFHGTCGGRDKLLDSCTCPDLAIQLRIRVLTGNTASRRFLCLCCELDVDPQHLPEIT